LLLMTAPQKQLREIHSKANSVSRYVQLGIAFNRDEFHLY
jgi:hypothetical protein